MLRTETTNIVMTLFLWSQSDRKTLLAIANIQLFVVGYSQQKLGQSMVKMADSNILSHKFHLMKKSQIGCYLTENFNQCDCPARDVVVADAL